MLVHCILLLIGVSGVIAAHDTSTNTIIVNRNSSITFAHPDTLFSNTAFYLDKTASVTVSRPTQNLSPHTLPLSQALTSQALSSQVSHLSEQVALLSKQATKDTLAASAGSVDQLQKEVLRLVEETEKNSTILRDLLSGQVDTAYTQLVSQEGIELANRLAVLDARLQSIRNDIQTYLTAHPLSSESEEVVAVVSQERVRDELLRAAEQGYTYHLDHDIRITSEHPITSRQSFSIDGKGHTLTLQGEEALVLADYVTLTLTNCTLALYGKHALSLAANAKLTLGQGVTILLYDDWQITAGTIECSVPASLVTLSGVGGMKRVVLPTSTSSFSLNRSSLVLSNCILHYADAIEATLLADGTQVHTGALILQENVILMVKHRLSAAIVVSGVHNGIMSIGKECNIDAPIRYDSQFGGTLTLYHTPTTAAVPHFIWNEKTLLLQSDQAPARLVLAMPCCHFSCRSADAVCLGQNGVIEGASTISLLQQPLALLHQSVHIGKEIVLTSDNPYALCRLGNEVVLPTYITAYEQDITDYSVRTELTSSSDAYHLQGTVRMDALSGKIVLKDGCIEEAVIDTTLAADITLAGNATLQASSGGFTVKEKDILRVSGINNTLIIPQRCIWSGLLYCEEGSQLTIALPRTASCIFSGKTTNSIVLEGGSRVFFHGPGSVYFNESLSFIGSGQKKAQVGLTQGVQARIASAVVVTLEGLLDVYIEDNAYMSINAGGSLFCGAYAKDDIGFTIDTGGTLYVGQSSAYAATAQQNPALFSCALGAYRLTCNRHGSLVLGSYAALECNVRQGKQAPGSCKGIMVGQDGRIYLSQRSELRLAENKVNILESSSLIEEVDGGFCGEGTVWYLPRNHHSAITRSLLSPVWYHTYRTFDELSKKLTAV